MSPIARPPSAADLDTVMAYRHPGVIAALRRDMNLTETEADRLFDDTKRFLYLSATWKGNALPTARIEKSWHVLILFTRDYARFSRTHFNRFLHHKPILGGDPAVQAAGVACTVEAARRLFGDLSKNWIEAGTRCGDCTPDGNCESPPSDCAVN